MVIKCFETQLNKKTTIRAGENGKIKVKAKKVLGFALYLGLLIFGVEFAWESVVLYQKGDTSYHKEIRPITPNINEANSILHEEQFFDFAMILFFEFFEFSSAVMRID